MSTDATAADQSSAELAMGLVEALAGEIGPRRPGSRAEALAQELIAGRMRERGLDASIDAFPAYGSFGYPYGAIAALALAPAALPRSWRFVRVALGLKAAALLAAEGSLWFTPLSDLLARGESHNVVATVEPRGEPARTLCLMAHADTSRSGLLFHPALGPYLQRWIAAQSVATLALAAEPVLGRTRVGRGAVALARAVVAAGLALLVERELRGRDVPGGNDNASGAGAVVQLAAEAAAAPLESTRLVVLINGAEEAGLLGARAFLDAHDTNGWLFVNLDGVGAPATLRFLPSEGVLTGWDADAGLMELARRIERERPELGLRGVDRPLGLTYDATAVLARGGRALTLVAGDEGRIPNYHRSADDVGNVDRAHLAQAVAVGRELVAAIDRGEAD